MSSARVTSIALALLGFASLLSLTTACTRAEASQESSRRAAEPQGPGSPRDSTLAGDTRFAAYDVLLDSGTIPLAAWQVEIVDASQRARVVAVEGGQHLAFAQPPHYDPRALMHGRIVLAAFSTDSTLPEGSSRVARVHVAIQGAAEPSLTLRVMAAAGSDGSTIRVRAALVRS